MKASELTLYKKVIALLHDPPHKPWVVTGRRILTSQDECKGLKAHECESNHILNQLFGIDITSSPYSDIWKEVEELDRLSSSFDRWLFEYELSKKSGSTKAIQREITFMNPFDPRYPFNAGTQPPSKDDLSKYVKDLKQLLKEVEKARSEDKLRFKYYVLYALMEPLWYGTIEFPPPADTRFPTHTVFDHVYATSSLVNVYESRGKDGGWKGYLVYIDFLSVQQFVKDARGPADAWAGSWLISALAWRTIEELVEKVGPEILITPTARYNPFFFNFLYVRLGCDNKKDSDLCKLLNSLRPEHPVMPPTMMLMLPEDLSEFGIKNEGSIKKYLLKKVKEAWKSLYLTMLEAILNKDSVSKYLIKDFRKGEDDVYLDRETKEKLLHCIKVMRNGGSLADCGVDKDKDPYLWYLLVTAYYPPVRPAITVVNLRKAYDVYSKERSELIKEIKEKLIELGFKADKDSVNAIVEKLFYHWLFTKHLKKVMFENRLIVNVGPAKPQVVAFTEKAFEKGIRSEVRPYRRCRCGLPAVVYKKDDSPESPNVIRPREALCPYCLTKRVIGYSYFFSNVIKELIGRDLGIKKTIYTIDLANRFNKKKKLGEQLEGISDSRKRAELLKDAFKYYGFIYADGDSIGELYHMNFGLSAENYFEKVAKLPEKSNEEKLKKYIELFSFLTEKFGVVQKKAEDLEECGKLGSDEGKNIPSTLLTPSIQAQISYSLMVTSLIDQRIIEVLGGTPVYLGGDDLVALIPLFGIPKEDENIKKGLEQLMKEYEILDHNLFNKIDETEAWRLYPGLVAWWLTRLNYWGLTGSYKGFLKLKLFSNGHNGTIMRAIAPALLAYGRKYGLYISHYREPIRLVYEEASHLESSGKNVKRKVGDKEIKKDTIAIKSRNAEVVIVPQTLFAKGKNWKANLVLGQTSLKMLKYFQDNERGKFSSNALRDAINLIESFKTDTTIGLLKRYEASVKLALYALERNIQGRDKELPEDVKEILEQLKDEEIITKKNGKPQEVEPVSLFLKFIQTWKGSKR